MEEQHDYFQKLEYFRWLSVISHTIVLNLRETIIPSLNIYGMNDSSTFGNWFFDEQTRGISFDGLMVHACKLPMGRQQPTKNKPWVTELIKPVEKMLKYLISEEDLKNGYHLSDILTKVCFVFGSESVFNQFESGVKLHLKQKTHHESMEEIKVQTKNDLNQFSARFRLTFLKSLDTINIKQLVYRSSTLFISALGRIHKILANSCFEIIEEMAKNNSISQNMRHKLCYAVAIACEMRLKVYRNNKSQHDNAIDLKNSQENVMKFLRIVGEASTINYFQIVYCLQCEVAKHFGFTKLHFYSNPLLINIAICIAFGLENFQTILSKDAATILGSKMDKFDFDASIEEIEMANTSNFKDLKKETGGFALGDNINVSGLNRKEQVKIIADYLYSKEIFDEAFEFYKYLQSACEIESGNEKDLAYSLDRMAWCQYLLKQPPKALILAEKSLEIYQRISTDESRDLDVANSMRRIGLCLNKLRKYDESLSYLHRSLEIHQLASTDEEHDVNVAWTLHAIGLCFVKKAENVNSLKYFKMSMKIHQNLSSNEDYDKNVAMLMHNIGYSLFSLQQYNEALLYYNRSLKIKENTSHCKQEDSGIALTLYYLSDCLYELEQYEEALNYCQKALTINQNISLDDEKDFYVARSFNGIGKCFMKLHSYDVSLINLKRSLTINQTILSCDRDSPSKFEIAYPLKDIGFCLYNCHKYGESLDYLKQSLAVFHVTPSNDKIKAEISTVTARIKECESHLTH